MSGLDPLLSSAENYRRFAQREAAGRSPAYEALAQSVAADDVILSYLATLPVEKRQPNLLFAAARFVLDAVPTVDDLRTLALAPDVLREVMMQRRTQTNEAARCATLLLALCQLPQPLALIEVGASAGLTLLPDRYSYDYDGHRVTGLDPAAPVLSCTIQGPAPLPTRVPDVAWRCGLDLNPLDPTDAGDADWLQCLVWPGSEDRSERLRSALEVARRTPVPIRRGDLVDDLTALVAEVPPEVATTVVFHSAVLAYVDHAKRTAFADLVQRLGVHWLSNEAPGVLPVTAGDGGHGFRLVENGRSVLAHTDPHGTWLNWTT